MFAYANLTQQSCVHRDTYSDSTKNLWSAEDASRAQSGYHNKVQLGVLGTDWGDFVRSSVVLVGPQPLPYPPILVNGLLPDKLRSLGARWPLWLWRHTRRLNNDGRSIKPRNNMPTRGIRFFA